MRWRDARQKRGAEGLLVRYSPGRPLKLDRMQRQRLIQLLLQWPTINERHTSPWTTASVAKLIGREFGVQYHRDHVGRLVRSVLELTETKVTT